MAVAEEPEEPSRAAGGCVLVVLGGGTIAAVFAASEEAGVLTVWTVGVAALWYATKRRMSDSSATPPLSDTPPLDDVYAGETGRVASIEKGPGEGLLIIRPERHP